MAINQKEHKVSKLIGGILIFIVLGILTLYLFGSIYQSYQNEIDGFFRGYTIQDVYNYCCKNPLVEITPVGDNCTQVVNEIYHGCYDGNTRNLINYTKS